MGTCSPRWGLSPGFRGPVQLLADARAPGGHTVSPQALCCKDRKNYHVRKTFFFKKKQKQKQCYGKHKMLCSFLCLMCKYLIFPDISARKILCLSWRTALPFIFFFLFFFLVKNWQFKRVLSCREMGVKR